MLAHARADGRVARVHLDEVLEEPVLLALELLPCLPCRRRLVRTVDDKGLGQDMEGEPEQPQVLDPLDLVLAVADEPLVEVGRGAAAEGHDEVRLVPERVEAGDALGPIALPPLLVVGREVGVGQVLEDVAVRLLPALRALAELRRRPRQPGRQRLVLALGARLGGLLARDVVVLEGR